MQKRLGEKGEGIRRRLMAIDERDRYELFQDYIDDLLQGEIDLEEKNCKESQGKIAALLKAITDEPKDHELSASSDSEKEEQEELPDFRITFETTFE